MWQRAGAVAPPAAVPPFDSDEAARVNALIRRLQITVVEAARQASQTDIASSRLWLKGKDTKRAAVMSCEERWRVWRVRHQDAEACQPIEKHNRCRPQRTALNVR